MSLISHDVQLVESSTNKATVSAPKAIDKNLSQVRAGNCYQSLYKYHPKAIVSEDEAIVGRYQHSNHKVVLGSTFQGLPFQVVVVCGREDDKRGVCKFIDTHIVPLIDQYARDLKNNKQKDAEVITQELIAKINSLRKDQVRNFGREYADDFDFTMSMVVSYKKNGNLFAAGYGIGGTAIAMKIPGKKIEQLVTTKFSKQDENAVEANLHHNTFHHRVEPNTEFVAYTYLAPILMKEVPSEEKSPVAKFALNPELIGKEATLFDNLVTLQRHAYEVLCAKTYEGEGSYSFGDDYSFTQSIVPNDKVQKDLIDLQFVTLSSQLKRLNHSIKNKELREEIEKLLQAMKKDGYFLAAHFTTEDMNAVLYETICLIQAPLHCRANKVEEFRQFANVLTASQSPASKAILILLLGLAATLAAISVILFTAGMVLPAVGMMAGSATLLLSNVGTFAYCKNVASHKTHDLMLDLHMLGDACSRDSEECSPT